MTQSRASPERQPARSRAEPPRRDQPLLAAERPLRVPQAAPQGACACGGTCPRCAGQCRATRAVFAVFDPSPVAPRAGQTADAVGAAGVGGAGRALDPEQRRGFEAHFGRDLGHVRLHTDPVAARGAAVLGAQAYTLGSHVALASRHAATDDLLAHELAHVVQQTRAPGGATPAGGSHEAQADASAAAFRHRRPAPALSAAAPGVQRRVEMRDVGRGEFSGFARLPELVDRLNAISPSLLFEVVGGVLTYEQVAGLDANEFDRQMIAFIDSGNVIPLRLTNRHGLLGDRARGFNEPVFADAWASGYVDIDDLLASTDLGLQSVLVHFLQERQSTRNYARRIGSPSMDFAQPGVQAEFDRVHAQGIDAEVRLLRDFFGDPSIRHIAGAESGDVARVYRNDRRDRIRTRVRAGRRAADIGVHAIFIDVRLHEDGSVISAEEYQALLEREREEAAVRAQVERERLAGATEHRAGGRSIPAP